VGRQAPRAVEGDEVREDVRDAALELLGEGLEPADVEVVRGVGGPPALRLSKRAAERMAALGADRTLVSLTHGRRQAAAAVLLVRDAS
jgi:phosphopantetheinyl transferase (holo-ACP synthase)